MKIFMTKFMQVHYKTNLVVEFLIMILIWGDYTLMIAHIIINIRIVSFLKNIAKRCKKGL